MIKTVFFGIAALERPRSELALLAVRENYFKIMGLAAGEKAIRGRIENREGREINGSFRDRWEEASGHVDTAFVTFPDGG